MIKTINFVEAGSEPKRLRMTTANKDLLEVIAFLKTNGLPEGKSLIVDTDPAKKYQAYALSKKLEKSGKINLEVFEVGRSGHQVVIRRKAAKEAVQSTPESSVKPTEASDSNENGKASDKKKKR